MTALLAGSVDIVSSGIDELIALRARGYNDTALIINVYRGLSGVLVVRKDVVEKLGVKLDAPSDVRFKSLEGLTVAAPSPSSSILGGYKITANLAGINLHYAYMQQTAMFAAMQTGAIQAYIASSPFWEPAVESGAAVRWISGPRGQLPEAALTTSSSALQTTIAFAKRNPDIIRKIHATFDDLVTAIRDRPADVIAALKQFYPDLSDKVLKEAFDQNSPNWLQSDFSEADLKKEVDMRRDIVPGIDKVNPGTLLLPR
jgi:ABC-type nitrate/sulfonate/bicarbonate transport system substrate-binding protein